VDWTHVVVTLAGHSHVLVYVIVGCFVLKRLPWLIAAFRVAIARNDDEAERARKALEAIEPHWHWIWQRRG
jgi:F0F1-type ATP synthase membrane subunit b/b'